MFYIISRFFIMSSILMLAACGGGGGGTPPANTAPSATSANITTDEDTVSTGVTPSVTDADSGDMHSFAITTQPTNGTVSVVTNKLVYTPNANYNGSDSFTYTATDSGGLSVTGTASVTINPIDDVPSVNNVGISDVNGGSAEMGDTLTGTYTFIDVDGGTEASTYSWFRDGAIISGEASPNYNIISSDANKLITFKVTAATANGLIGNSITSGNITIASISKKINDTGSTLCGDYAYTDNGTSYDIDGSGIHNNMLNCSTQPTVPTETTDGYDSNADIIRAGQDALYGRDVTSNNNSDGYAGLSFTKLDSNGDALADQTQSYAANPWSCVRDNITGLIWEVKLTSGLQNMSSTYTWYSVTNNGGNAGLADSGSCTDGSGCDTEKYVADVNASNGGLGICGANDWRLPNKDEILSIMISDKWNRSIDINYFPNTGSAYWTSSTYAGNAAFPWMAYFFNGYLRNQDRKTSAMLIRLVRDSL